jgi:3-phosphoshikimate 1-carboxyvinyltransferase
MKRATKPLQGTIYVPGDKSISHRAAIMAALGRGKSCLRGFLRADDTLNTLKIFQALGISVTGLEAEGEIEIQGRGLHGLREADDILYSGNSGTTTRLLTGLLSAQSFFSVISGDTSLNQRPMGRIIKPLSRMGATIWGREHHTMPPLAIQGQKLAGITYSSPIASAQVKTSLMLAGLYANGPLTITEPSLSRDHTERIFKALGIPVQISVAEDGIATISMSPAQHEYNGADFIIPGDISAAAFFLVAAMINRGSQLTITNVGLNPTRNGIIQALQKMGGEILIENLREASGEPVADLTVHGNRQLQGTEISGALIPLLIDEIPILALAAAHAEGTTTIRNAGELRVKESDRLEAITLLLDALGTKTEALEDGIIIHGGVRVPAKRQLSFKTFYDHRIAMTAIIAGITEGKEVQLDNNHCISTSFPNFNQLLAEIRQ